MNSAANQRLNILIVGATGQLGSLITKHCLATPALLVNILIRDPKKNPELVEQVKSKGGKVLTGDLSRPETLAGKTKGMHTVVSTLSSISDPSIFFDAQVALVDECVKSGVERFVPSDFGVNYTKFTREEVAPLHLANAKLRFHDYLKTQPIKSLHIWAGLFIETFFDIQSRGLTYWGDASHRWDLTCYEDIAKVTPIALANKESTGNFVFIGNRLTVDEVSAIYNKVRGTNIVPEQVTSLEELKRQYEETKEDQAMACKLGLRLVLNDQRSAFDGDNNDDFPEVTPTSLEEFLKENPDLQFNQTDVVSNKMSY